MKKRYVGSYKGTPIVTTPDKNIVKEGELLVTESITEEGTESILLTERKTDGTISNAEIFSKGLYVDAAVIPVPTDVGLTQLIQVLKSLNSLEELVLPKQMVVATIGTLVANAETYGLTVVDDISKYDPSIINVLYRNPQYPTNSTILKANLAICFKAPTSSAICLGTLQLSLDSTDYGKTDQSCAILEYIPTYVKIK